MSKRWVLAASCIMAGCMTNVPLSHKGTLILKSQVLPGSYAVQTSLPNYTQSSIHHLILKLYTYDVSEHDQGIEKSILNAQLDNTITFSNLKANTTYRIKALAYASSDNSVLISSGDENSYTDVQLTSDDRPTFSTLRVKLIDRAFNGQSTASGVVVTAGSLVPAGNAEMEFPLQRIVTTFVGSTYGSLDGIGTAATFKSPRNLAIDAQNNLYVAEEGGPRVRKVTPAGVVTTIAGSVPGFVDGTGTSALFQTVTGICIDSSNNLYVTDSGNHVVRKITPTGVVTTLAGNGTVGFADGLGTNASFNCPYATAVDSSGNVYVADSDNHAIRKITPAGLVSTIAGNGTAGATDGLGSNATFYRPRGIALDSSGNLYIADRTNSLIRKITPEGMVSTIAGNGVATFADGTGTNASFNYPISVMLDRFGNIYVGDNANHRVRKIDTNRVVTTLAGSGVGSFADGTGNSAGFNQPLGMAMDSSGYLYVADYTNNRIRRIK